MGRLGKMSMPMVIMFFIVSVVGILMGFGHLKEAMTTDLGAPIVENFNTKMLFKSGLTYGLVQLGSFQALTVMAGKFESHSDTVKFILLGFLINCGALVLSYLSLMAYYPDVLETSLPSLGIIQQLSGAGYVILMIMYNAILILAYITTAGGMASGAQARYMPLVSKKISNETVCRVVIVVFFFTAATALSTLGLDGILTTINSINAYCRLRIWYVPVLILGPIAIYRVKKAQKQQ